MAKRKAAASLQADLPASKRQASSFPTSSITSFARVSKAVQPTGMDAPSKPAIAAEQQERRTATPRATIGLESGKSRSAHAAPAPALVKAAPSPSSSRKRKLATASSEEHSETRRKLHRSSLPSIPEEADPSPTTATAAITDSTSSSKRRRLRQAILDESSPLVVSKADGASSKKGGAKVSDAAATAWQTQELLERLRLSDTAGPGSPTRRCSPALSSSSGASSTMSSPASSGIFSNSWTPNSPPTSVASECDAFDFDFASSHTATLPSQLQDIKTMFAALLKTLVVHRAHNSTSAGGSDLATLLPEASRAWGKRKIVLDDVRVCVAVLGGMSSVSGGPKGGEEDDGGCGPLEIVDYGRGRVCLELKDDNISSSSSIINEPRLNAVFAANLAKLWTAVAKEETDATTAASIQPAWLPRAKVHKRSAALLLLNASASAARGHAALRELKVDRLQAAKPAVVPSSQQKPATTTTLIERLRAKEAQLAASLASAADAQQALAHRAALQRCPDIASVVSMLSLASNAGSRMSLPLQTLLRRLRDSLAVPLADAEATAAVRVLSSDVVPGWLSIVRVAGRDMVIVERAKEVCANEVRRRVEDLLEKAGQP